MRKIKTIFFELRACPITKEIRAYIKDLDITHALLEFELEVRLPVEVSRFQGEIDAIYLNYLNMGNSRRVIELLGDDDE